MSIQTATELQLVILDYIKRINTCNGQTPYSIQGYTFIGTISLPLQAVPNVIVRLLCVTAKHLPGRSGLQIVTYPWTKALSCKLRDYDTQVVYTYMPYITYAPYTNNNRNIIIPRCRVLNSAEPITL